MKKTREVDLTPKYALGMSTFIYIVCTYVGGMIGFALGYKMQVGTAMHMITIIGNVLLIPIIYSLMMRSGLGNGKINKNNIVNRYVPIGIIAFILFDSAFIELITLMNVGTGNLAFWKYAGENSNVIVAIIGGVIIGPLAEELYFRGIIFGAIRQKKGFAWAAIISSTVFGICHGSVLYFICSFLAGVFFALIYELTQNLCASIVLHILNNFLAYIEKDNWVDEFTFNLITNTPMKIVIVIIMFVIVGIIMIYEFKALKKQSKDFMEKEDE